MTATVPTELSALLELPTTASREQSWKAFLSAYSRLLLHTARSISGDADAVMDAYTHVLGALREDDFRRLRAYAPDGRTKFTTWLVVVARRLCIDHHRQRYGRTPEADSEQHGEHAARRRLEDLVAEPVDPEQLSHSAPDAPDARLESEERLQALSSSLAALEARDRLLLKLRFEDDLSAREIATIMGFPTPFHVYRRLTTVLGSLKATLRQRGIASAGP